MLYILFVLFLFSRQRQNVSIDFIVEKQIYVKAQKIFCLSLSLKFRKTLKNDCETGSRPGSNVNTHALRKDT